MPTPPASDNPYESPTAEQAERKEPVIGYRRHFMVAGGFCVAVAALFMVAGVVGMRLAVEKVKTSTTSNLSEITADITRASLLMYPAVALVMVGYFLLVFGFRFRKREG